MLLDTIYTYHTIDCHKCFSTLISLFSNKNTISPLERALGKNMNQSMCLYLCAVIWLSPRTAY